MRHKSLCSKCFVTFETLACVKNGRKTENEKGREHEEVVTTEHKVTF